MGALNSPSLTPESDQQLLLDLSRGRPQAVALLYQQHGPRMVGFARRYVNSSGAAEDVVVGLLGRWLEHPPHVREVERLSAFLATSVYHAAVDWMRRDRAEQGQPPRGTPSVGPVDSRKRAPLAEPESTASRQSLQARLENALGRLSGSDRLLLETHYGRALTPDECMAQMAIGRAAFHQRLHRARTRLARLLASDEMAEAREEHR